MAVQRLPGDPELLAEVANLRFLLTHRGHGQADLGGRHLERPPARPPPCSSCGKPGDSALRNERPLELGESSKDSEDELPRCRRGVDRSALSGEHLEADATVGEVMHRIDQVTQVSAEPVQLPNQERVTMTQRL